MEFKSIKQSLLTMLLLSTSLCAFAGNTGVLCPSVDLIKQSWEKLDAVAILSRAPNKFAVYTTEGAFDISNLSWHVTTTVHAPDLNNAFALGQINVKSVVLQDNKYALEGDGHFYLCGYLDSTGNVSTAAMAFENKEEKFKFASFDFNSLKLNSH